MKELHTLVDEMEDSLSELDAIMAALQVKASNYVDARCNYEEKKNKKVLELKNLEQADPSQKTTDKVKENIYRSEFAFERKAWLQTEADYEVSQLCLKGIDKKISALQTLIRLQEVDYNRSDLDRREEPTLNEQLMESKPHSDEAGDIASRVADSVFGSDQGDDDDCPF